MFVRNTYILNDRNRKEINVGNSFIFSVNVANLAPNDSTAFNF